MEPPFGGDENVGFAHADRAERMRWLLLIGLVVCLPVSAKSAGTLDAVSQREILRIGYIADEAPFSSSKPDEKPTGYAIDLCGKIADDIEHVVPGLKRDYVELTLANGFDAGKSGQVDLLCGAIT